MLTTHLQPRERARVVEALGAVLSAGALDAVSTDIQTLLMPCIASLQRYTLPLPSLAAQRHLFPDLVQGLASFPSVAHPVVSLSDLPEARAAALNEMSVLSSACQYLDPPGCLCSHRCLPQDFRHLTGQWRRAAAIPWPTLSRRPGRRCAACLLVVQP